MAPTTLAKRAPRGRRPRLDSVQELEERIAETRLARAHTRRARRFRLCFACATILAGILGYSLGFASRRTSAESPHTNQAMHRRQFDLSKEVNRTLLELWKMEDFESVRDEGRTR